MRVKKRGLALWAVYFGFVAWVLYAYWHEAMFRFDTPAGNLKLLVWLVLAVFLVYSVYCSLREDLFRSIGSIATLHWGRQIGIDLYLGLSIGTLLIYLHEGPIAVLIWIVPIIAFANLAMLLYIAVNFDSIVVRFLGS